MPGGVLAKHGYRVAGFGFFMGTCGGSGYRPFELDNAEAIRSRAAVAEHAGQVEAQADAEQLDRAQVWIHYYDQKLRGWGRGGYRWVSFPVRDVVLGYRTEYAIEGKPGEVSTYTSDPAAAHAYLNNLRAESTRGVAKSMRDYVKWQDGRLADWSPHPEALTIIAGAAA